MKTEQTENNPPALPEDDLRDWFAGQALPAIYTEGAGELSEKQIARDAYSMADAMLAARKEVQP